MQPYKVFVVEDAAVRKKLRTVAFNQPQITDSSYLFVFCSYKSVSADDIGKYMQLTADTRELDIEALGGFNDALTGAVSRKGSEVGIWTSKQAYIALGTLISAASELNIDTCPMEGFIPAEFDEILGLEEQGLTASVITAVGYRSEDDETQFAAKVRKAKEDLFVQV